MHCGPPRRCDWLAARRANESAPTRAHHSTRRASALRSMADLRCAVQDRSNAGSPRCLCPVRCRGAGCDCGIVLPIVRSAPVACAAACSASRGHPVNGIVSEPPNAGVYTEPHRRWIAEAFTRMADHGDLNLPVPGSGVTRARWESLTRCAQQNLSLVRLAEGHTDAVATLAELDSAGACDLTTTARSVGSGRPSRPATCWRRAGCWAAGACSG